MGATPSASSGSDARRAGAPPTRLAAARRLAAFVACCAFAGFAPAARAMLVGPPTFTVATETATLGGASAPVDVYKPIAVPTDDAANPPRVAIVAHGFTRDRTRGRDLARVLASEGIVAVVPDLPNLVDYDGNGDALRDVVDALERGAFGMPPVPRGQVVLIGTSAGGAAALVAASKLPGLAGWVGLDPVDVGAVAAQVGAKLTVPAVVLLGEPSLCNLFGSGRTIARSLPTLVRVQRVDGASHCDFEGPTNDFCRAVCGKSARGMGDVVRREAVDAALTMLGLSARRQLGAGEGMKARPAGAADDAPPEPDDDREMPAAPPPIVPSPSLPAPAPAPLPSP